jgi:hypothetical protein
MTGSVWRNGAGVHLIVPPAIWALHFSLFYAVETAFCAQGGIGTPFVILAAISFVAFAVQFWIMNGSVRRYREEGTADFILLAGFALALLSTCATLWTTLSAFILPGCR